MTEHYRIAIDGPAGAGKSTVAKAVAGALGIYYLDTGAMYRTLALAAKRRNVNCGDETAVKSLLPQVNIEVRYEEGVQHMLLDNEDVTALLRSPDMSMGASDISAHPCVRDYMTLLQRQAAAAYPMVMDGRDITTNVLPDTPYKFYLTASPEERAKRRFEEFCARGDTAAKYEDVLSDIVRRDHNDSTRAYMPLKIAGDAVVIDTTALSIMDVTNAVLTSIQEKRRA